jgi:2-oxoglutarate ferredoxin oxidoreductase subunit beta
MELLEHAREKQELITGLLYINQERPTLPELLHMTTTPLSQLPQERMRPSREAFTKLMDELM